MPSFDPLPILSAEQANNFAERASASKSAQVYSSALELALRSRIAGEVRFDTSSRALYASDGSSYRQVPIGVVIPRSYDDVIATLATCREQSAPVLSRGAATSIAVQCCNAAVAMHFANDHV